MGAEHISGPVYILMLVTILLLACQVGNLQHQNIQTVWSKSRVICYAGMHTFCLHCSHHSLYFLAIPVLCDYFHDATVTALTLIDVGIRPINPSKSMTQYLWFVVHYTMVLPDNLLDTTMTALRLIIIFMIIIHEIMSDQRKGRPYMNTAVHEVSVKSLPVSAMWCVCWYAHHSITSWISFPLICTDA